MSEAAFKISFDAKNYVFERPPVKSSREPSDATPLKRRAPKSPPKNRPVRKQSDD